jgi:hypothetical protein
MPAQAELLASTNGFSFVNDWPSEPAVVLNTPFGKVNVGNAQGGLCGGMVFAALDYWHAGRVPPDAQPAQGEPLFRFLVKRIVDSWHVPAGVAQYYQWMSLPDGDAGFSAFGKKVVVERGLAWRTIKVQWPQIKRDLDRGLGAPLGLVTTASHQPKDLGLNHQVLAYGYSIDGRRVTVRVYDPNRGQDDSITIEFDAGTPTRATTFEHNLGMSHPVRGFFKTAYAPVTPPTT